VVVCCVLIDIVPQWRSYVRFWR